MGARTTATFFPPGTPHSKDWFPFGWGTRGAKGVLGEAPRRPQGLNDTGDAFSGESLTTAGAVEKCNTSRGKWTGNLRGEAAKVLAAVNAAKAAATVAKAQALSELAAKSEALEQTEKKLGDAEMELVKLADASGKLAALAARVSVMILPKYVRNVDQLPGLKVGNARDPNSPSGRPYQATARGPV